MRHPDGSSTPDASPASRIDDVPAQSTVVTLRAAPSPVGRVRKFWGEFF
jgi:hypothetical protein